MKNRENITNSNEMFPSELLQCDDQKKLEYFKEYIVSHRFLKETVDKTINYLRSPIDERLIFVCAPSGAGKKEFINGLTEKILEISDQAALQNRGFIPVVSIEANAPSRGSINYNNLWMQALIKMNEPMLKNKITYSDYPEMNEIGQYTRFSRFKKADTQDVLHNALRNRQVKALIINEGHHMFETASGRNAYMALNMLKSVTNRGQTPIIIVGTYNLIYTLADLDYTTTDQIMQRARVIDFPRYNIEIDEEAEFFAKAAIRLMLNMPLEKTAEDLVMNNLEYFYKYTLGCIGNLKIWLTDTYLLALDSKSKTITKEQLEKTRLIDSTLSLMLKSIKQGEKIMTEFFSPAALDIKLGLSIPRDDSTKENTNGKVRNNKSQPFKRKAKRDPVK